MNLKDNYEKAVNDYLKVFCEKQEMYVDFWVGDKIGEICSIGDMFLNFTDIKTDIDTEQPKGLISEWFWQTVEKDLKCNYEHYTMGYRKEFKKKK